MEVEDQNSDTPLFVGTQITASSLLYMPRTKSINAKHLDNRIYVVPQTRVLSTEVIGAIFERERALQVEENPLFYLTSHHTLTDISTLLTANNLTDLSLISDTNYKSRGLLSWPKSSTLFLPKPDIPFTPWLAKNSELVGCTPILTG